VSPVAMPKSNVKVSQFVHVDRRTRKSNVVTVVVKGDPVRRGWIDELGDLSLQVQGKLFCRRS